MWNAGGVFETTSLTADVSFVVEGLEIRVAYRQAYMLLLPGIGSEVPGRTSAACFFCCEIYL